jgi:hypothetical protein
MTRHVQPRGRLLAYSAAPEEVDQSRIAAGMPTMTPTVPKAPGRGLSMTNLLPALSFEALQGEKAHVPLSACAVAGT